MVKVAVRLMASVDAPLNGPQKTAYDRLLKTLPNQGKWCVLLPLSQRADGVWHAQGWTEGNAKFGKKPELLTWLYDANFGLRLNDTAEVQLGETTE